MSLTKYERGTSWKSQVTYTSGTTNINCSGNMAYLTVYKPDGTTLMGSVSGINNVGISGVYYYYPSTNTTSPLGIYVEEWKAYFDYGSRTGWRIKYDREPVWIVHVK